jgi:TonB family protein
MKSSASRVESDQSRHIGWTLPDKALNVRVTGTALSVLQTKVNQSRSRRPHICAGGLLLGTCVRSDTWNITIEEHVPLEWDGSRGGAPFLSEDQKSAFQHAVSNSASNSIVIGTYRATRASESDGNGATVCDLPVGRALAEADRFLLANCSSVLVSVGIKLRVPSLEPLGFVLWEDANLYELVPAAAQLPGDSVAQGPRISKRVVEEVSPLIPTKLPEPEIPPAPLPPMDPHRNAEPNTRLVTFWILGTIIVSVLTYVASHLYLKPLLLEIASKTRIGALFQSPDSASTGVVLGLRINHSGNALELTWDRLSPVLQRSIAGTLIINNGAASREIHLTRTELQNGRITYIPQPGDVRFRLEVSDTSSRTIAESIQVLSGPLSVTSRQAQNLTTSSKMRFSRERRLSSATRTDIGVNPSLSTTASVQGKEVNAASTRQETNQRPAMPATDKPLKLDTRENGADVPPWRQIANEKDKPVQQSATPSSEGSTLQNIPAPRPEISPSLQSLFPTDTGNVALFPSADTDQPRVAAMRSERPLNQISQNKPSSPQSDSTSPASSNGKDIRPVIVLSRHYPSLQPGVGPFLLNDLLVSVTVNIDQSGAVASAALTRSSAKVPAYLGAQALNAARMWRFSPAIINGRPVASEMEIRFHFSPAH